MTYITDEELDELPDDPMLRFVGIERLVRERYEEHVDNLSMNESALSLARRYMSIVLPAAKLYGVPGLQAWQRPSADVDTWDTYNAFFADVDYAITEIRLQNAERQKRNSVRLDAAAKETLRHLVRQMRDAVDKLEVSVNKREKLYARLSDLESEVNRDRTKFEAMGALFIEACVTAGKGAEQLEPLVRLIERVGAAIGVAKDKEDAQPRLPSPREPKRIEDKSENKSQTNGGNFDKQLDDEIPF